MDSVTLRNFRCFRDEQTARLAPLTLLVGENSTGKTSFMAMIRALWDVAYRHVAPDFKEEPYDLGSFDEIAHHRGGRGGRPEAFEARFEVAPTTYKDAQGGANRCPYRFDATFERVGTAPHPVKLRVSRDRVSAESTLMDDQWSGQCQTPTKQWVYLTGASGVSVGEDVLLVSPFYLTQINLFARVPEPTADEMALIRELLDGFYGHTAGRPYASGPVRSKPRRTYNPARASRDPEGDYIPMYLASTYFQEPRTWAGLQEALVRFGRAAGLFDEIAIKPLGKRNTEPFQITVRKGGKRAKGPSRNLIDVGYGVSQALPLVTELLRPDAPSMFLLQQPEVHLHPSAQAALGSLFCQVASRKRRLIVETHSDHLLDRVRMDVRDGKTELKPEDVSILFFERGDSDVCVHSLRIDGEGNIVDAPGTYRSFFMDETRRSLGL